MKKQQGITNALGAGTITPAEAMVILDMHICEIEEEKIIKYIKMLRRAEEFRKKREEEERNETR